MKEREFDLLDEEGIHEILMETEVDCPEGLPSLIRQGITLALAEEGVGLPCEINVLLTNDAGIQEINEDMREKDMATDVLSFPMFDLEPLSPPTAEDKGMIDPCSGLLPLGDMVLSLERVEAQALEYGHSFRRECLYLVVHSVLHLLGYDHLDEGAMKRQMREREKILMDVLTGQMDLS